IFLAIVTGTYSQRRQKGRIALLRLSFQFTVVLLRVREYCAVVPISLTAATLAELSEKLAIARDQKTRIDSIDLGGLNRILEHTPEDMTVTVEAGVALRELQAHLARRGQWLPIDPPF